MPFLILRTGLSKGASWPITGAPLLIGREQGCQIALPDALISRKHCEIVLSAGQILLRDLGSSNATFVNGKPVDTCTLQPGDQVMLGRTVLLVSEEDHSEDAAQPEALSRTTVSLTEGQAIYLQRDPLEGSDNETPHRTADLAQLFNLSRSFSRVDSLNELIAQLTNAVLDRFNPLDLWIALLDDTSGELQVAKQKTFETPAKMPEAAMRQALADMRGFLVPERTRMDNAKVLQLSLIAPIHFAGQGIAAIALRSHSRHRLYDETDLHFLVSLANTAAPFFEAIRHRTRLQREVRRLRQARQQALTLVGESPCMQRVRQTIQEVADTPHPVLIVGETGTGKEIVANLIHEFSGRATGPFVPVNCAAIARELFESELFGHERGAFTGASERKTGMMEQSNGGTLFLDEIGDLSPEHQAAILRALETKTFRRVGGKDQIASDFRIVAATNRNIHQEVASGTFRRDLYHRLRGVEILIEPLRERPADIAELAEHFLEAARPNCKHPLAGFEPDTLEFLRAQPWPGNARELRYCIESAVTFCKNDRIAIADMQTAMTGPLRPGAPRPLSEIERHAIEEALAFCGGNVVQAARLLGVGKDTLYRRLAQYRNQD